MSNKYNSILVFILLMFSGNPSINFFVDTKWLLIFAAFFVFFNNLQHLRIETNRHLYFFLVFFCSIFSLQYLNLGFVSFLGALNFLLKITFGYVIFKKCGRRSRVIYFNVIYYIALISLFGFTLNCFGINMPIKIDDKMYSILIYNQNLTEIAHTGIRNSGMFWEPGAFAIYINLAFLLFAGNLKPILKKHMWRVCILTTALITTFSTTGYILFFIILLHYYLFEYRKNKFISISISLVFLTFSIYLFNNLPFLKNKAFAQYENIQNKDNDEFSPDRFGAFLFDLHYIEKNPLTGNGFHVSTRYVDHPWLANIELGHGNGFSNFTASMGVLSMVFYLFNILKFASCNRFLVLTIVVLSLQGEQLLNFPLFLALPFIFKTFNEKYSRITYVS